VFNAHATVCNRGIFGFLLITQLLPTRLLMWLRDLDAIKPISLKAQILEQFAAIGQGIRGYICNWFVMRAALVGITQKMYGSFVIS